MDKAAAAVVEMSAKVKYTLGEDKQELRKQLGCMNGIFQLFDRRYLLGQRSHGPSHKVAQGQSDNGKKEFNNAPGKPKENSPNKGAKEKHRVSVESSRNSFSSSCSSTTFSSLDCSKRVQTEHSSFCQSIVSEPSSPTLHNKQPDLYVHPPDIRDVVKDSMTRKPRVVSVKTVAKDERRGPVMTHVDSPRPLQHPISIPYDRKDQNLARLREISLGVKEVKEASRFSCDGRESPYKLKSIGNVKELPRLSLDSKQSSIRNCTNESRRILLIRETQGGGETKTSIQTLDQTHEPGSNKRPLSGVVARLMGLEVLTDIISEGETVKIKPCSDDESISLSRSSRKGEESKHNRNSVSPRVHNELASPQRGIGNAITRIPLEPAPWKQEGGSRCSQKPVKNKKAPERADHASHSVYGEIEKRLVELEFKTSGKDLRALKQILEAMQRTRMRLENKEDLDNSSSDQKQSQRSVLPVSPTIKGTGPLKKHEFLSTAAKPAHQTSDSVMSTGLQKVNRRIKNLTPREKKATGRSKKLPSPSDVPEYLTGQNSAISRNSGTLSPRLQGSKNGINKQSTRGSSSDLNRIRKQSNGQPTVTDSKTRNSKTKSINPLQNNEQPCRYTRDTRNLSRHGDKVSFPSESTTSVASQDEPEVMSTDWTRENNSVYQPKGNHKNKFAESLIEYKPMAELAMLTMEQPSPVSVLDAFYTEDTPSPIQKKSYAFNDDADLHFDEPEWNQAGIEDLVSSTELDQCYSEFNHVNTENIKHLVHQIELLNSGSDEATINCTPPSAFDSINGDHRYISEILLASGFLKNLDCATTIVRLHPTGSLINPELFHVLEKTKECTELTDDEFNKKNASSKSNEKIRRKMVFDTVNDILVQKLAISDSSGLWNSKREGRILNGDKLLKELWSEINNLQTNTATGLYDEIINIISADVNKKSEDWDNYCNEVLVLDIERLIFKDLINEVVNAEVAGLQDGPGTHCRQLFPM